VIQPGYGGERYAEATARRSGSHPSCLPSRRIQAAVRRDSKSAAERSLDPGAGPRGTGGTAWEQIAELRTEGTVLVEGGLVLMMKINGQGPFRTVFDTGAVNVVSTTFAKLLGFKAEEAPVHFGAIGGVITVHTAHVDTVANRRSCCP